MPNDTFRTEGERLKSIRRAMKFEEERIEPLTVIRQVETSQQAENMFDPLSYSKGCIIIIGIINYLNQSVLYMKMLSHRKWFTADAAQLCWTRRI